jgi:hypothetical protein
MNEPLDWEIRAATEQREREALWDQQLADHRAKQAALDAELAAIRHRLGLAELAHEPVDDVPRLLDIIDQLRAELAEWEQDHLDRHGWKEWRVPVDGSIYR